MVKFTTIQKTYAKAEKKRKEKKKKRKEKKLFIQRVLLTPKVDLRTKYERKIVFNTESYVPSFFCNVCPKT